MPEHSVMQFKSRQPSQEAGRRARALWLWAMFCFWLMPGLGLALTMVVGFQQIEGGDQRMPSLIEQLLAYSWLALPAVGLAVFGIVLWRQARADDAEADVAL